MVLLRSKILFQLISSHVSKRKLSIVRINGSFIISQLKSAINNNSRRGGYGFAIYILLVIRKINIPRTLICVRKQVNIQQFFLNHFLFYSFQYSICYNENLLVILNWFSARGTFTIVILEHNFKYPPVFSSILLDYFDFEENKCVHLVPA